MILSSADLKETKFIQKNEKKWQKFEKLYARKDKDPEQLTDLFLEITNDLSYARTNYEKRTVRVYLNQLAQKVFSSFYLKKKNPAHFLQFWSTTLPLELYRSRKNMLAGFFVFLVAALIGIISQEYDHNFFRVIAGDRYVNDTLKNIKKGNPLAVYGDGGEAFTFLWILLNNLRVTVMIFAAGIFFSVGTYLMTLFNGIMVGSFQWFFKTQGLLLASFLGIWIHGAFEISAIVIAAGAGITVGNGLLFPGSLSRKNALVRSGIRGLRIMLGALVLIVFAAFFEGYLTRHYNDLSNLVKALFIFTCFAIVIGYFIIYPFFVAKKHDVKAYFDEPVPETTTTKTDRHQIRKSGNVFVLSFKLYGQNFKKYLKFFLLSIFPLMLLHLYWSYYNYWNFFDNDLYWYENLRILFNSGPHNNIVGQVITLLCISIAICNVGFCFHSDKPSLKNWFQYIAPRIFFAFLFVILLFNIFIFLNFWLLLLFFFVSPFFIGGLTGLISSKKFSFSQIGKGFSVSSKGYANFLGIIALMTLITCIFFQILAGIKIDKFEMPDLLDSVFSSLIQLHTKTLFTDFWVYVQIVKSTFFLGFLYFIIPLWAFNFLFTYFSEVEKEEAIGLENEINNFGVGNNLYEQTSDFE